MSKKPVSRLEILFPSRKRIWVTGFPECILKDDLWKLFRPFGDIDSISIVRNCMKQPIAFIDMKNSSDAQRAIRDLDKQFFLGRNITVRESQQKFYEERFIYALLSFDKRECYIGETCDTIKRFRQHLNGKGDKSTSSWILTLKDSKPKPIILEIVQPGYDAHFQANFLETVWRLVASICCWEVINFPFLSDIREELKAAVTPRISKWLQILDKVSEISLLEEQCTARRPN